jgi:hypothetical protein
MVVDIFPVNGVTSPSLPLQWSLSRRYHVISFVMEGTTHHLPNCPRLNGRFRVTYYHYDLHRLSTVPTR